ncbi:PhoH-like protein [Polystyrenella longa]|uniref:PhoH-like protein n=1 Tax=Polystyrenella longa TaxID=2528007 RepID=A0A518CQ40_9PLAN|nr:PhoH family protein [Polystyrenella longa]QDU81342.1 PhoH-like protein [Polystyrenella longa]
MTEATLPVESTEMVRALFGNQDRYLRQIRDSIGVDILVRGDEIRLQGQSAQVERGVSILQEMQSIIEQRGFLRDEEVDRVLKNPGAAREELTKETAAPVVNGESVAKHVAPLHESLKKIKPRTPGQVEYVKAIQNHDMIFCTGPAGCGKTFLAAALAVNDLREEKVRKIVLVRPAVEAGERLGFLPGDLLSKVNPYLRPLLDALHDLLDYDQVKRYMENDIIEIIPLAFMRGRTLNDTFIILDEGQNTTCTQMKMFLTRMGHNSKIVVTGDVTQIDLDKGVQSGMKDAMRRLSEVSQIAKIRMRPEDIVRHPLVARIVAAYDGENSSDGKTE